MARQKNAETLVAITGQVTPGVRKALEGQRYNPETGEISTFGGVVRRVVEAGLKALDVKVVEPVTESTDDKATPAPKTR